MDSFLGLDVGTQGARAVVYDVSRAEIVARASQSFPPDTVGTDLPEGQVEQHPQGWWQAVRLCLQQVTQAIGGGEGIRALSVTSTSGTLCLLDADGKPVIPALMYNDSRARTEARDVQEAGADLASRMGYRFNASFALSKLLWLARHRPQQLQQARFICHAADFIVGQLCGVYDVTDYSNALKTGYDLSPDGQGRFFDRWPDFIAGELGLPVDRLPRVLAPGDIIGAVTPQAAKATGLRADIPVVAGMTDGCAGQIAAGAVAPGDWNSTLGTTLVIKGVTNSLLLDPQGRIYSHRHPDGYWLPGGASNVGGEILVTQFPDADLRHFDRSAANLSPTNVITYPLARQGERFPFVRPDAEGFWIPFVPAPGTETPPGTDFGKLEATGPVSVDPPAFFAACLEGVAYLERLAYEMLESLGAGVGNTIRSAGGASRSNVWLQIRADVLNRELLRPVDPGAAMGAAILAASRTAYDGIIPAARDMVQVDRQVQPRTALVGHYQERYQRFRAACVERGYI